MLKALKSYLLPSILLALLIPVVFSVKAQAQGGNSFHGIDLSSIYDYEYYRNHNEDLVPIFGDDQAKYLDHFIFHGSLEGRAAREIPGDMSGLERLRNLINNTGKVSSVNGGIDYSPVYDYYFYAYNNPDLIGVFGYDAAKYLSHFIVNGMSEGRQGSADFDVISYKNSSPDLRAIYGNSLKKYYTHYLNGGLTEGRTTKGDRRVVAPMESYGGVDFSGIYNFNYYMEMNPDLKDLYGADDISAFGHYLIYGAGEGRPAHPAPNYEILNKFKNLTKIWGSEITSYRGVNLAPVYHPVYYAWNNPQIAVSCEYDPNRLLENFVKEGMPNGLSGKGDFDPEVYERLKYEVNTDSELGKMADVANQYESPTGIIILVNKQTKNVGVFDGGKGNYSAVNSFKCAIGADVSPTPNGVYQVGIKGLYFDTGTAGRCWYYTQIKGNYLFHSQIYDRQNQPVNLIDGRMGVAVSHGCIRLHLENAKWIYDNVPRGSTIVIY